MTRTSAQSAEFSIDQPDDSGNALLKLADQRRETTDSVFKEDRELNDTRSLEATAVLRRGRNELFHSVHNLPDGKQIL